MSVELPEIHILAAQMNKVLPRKKIKNVEPIATESLQKVGLMNRKLEDYYSLVGKTIQRLSHRGMTIVVEFDDSVNLLISAEYGGEVRYHKNLDTVPKKYNIKIEFTDNSIFTIRLKSMGAILVLSDDGLKEAYTYKRDFGRAISPTNDNEFTLESFMEVSKDSGKSMKGLLVGKDSPLVGLGNAAYQEIIYESRIHPKRKARELNKDEIRALYDAIKKIVKSRLEKGGKDQFVDLHGNQGEYKLIMGSQFRNHPCPRCGTAIVRAQIGGGHTHFCPSCQKE